MKLYAALRRTECREKKVHLPRVLSEHEILATTTSTHSHQSVHQPAFFGWLRHDTSQSLTLVNDNNRKMPDEALEQDLTRLTLEILKSHVGRYLDSASDGNLLLHLPIRRAVLLAEKLHQAVRDRGHEPIHAYRLFPTDKHGASEPMGQDQILQYFHEAGWVDGMKEGSLRKRIEEILLQITKVIDQRREGLQQHIERRDFGSPLDDDIDGVVGGLLDDFAVPEVIGDASELRAEVSRTVRRLIDRALAPALRESGTSESPTDPLTIGYFMQYVCGHATLDAAMEARSAKQLRVRPYELFLFAHQHNVESIKLTRLRRDLDENFSPQPEYTSSLPIMVSYAGAEAALRQWEDEERTRRREREEHEVETSRELLLKRLEKREQEEAAAIRKISTTAAMATERLQQTTSEIVSNIGGKLAADILAWMVKVGGLRLADEKMAEAAEKVADMMVSAIEDGPKKQTSKKTAKKKSTRPGSGNSGR